MEAINNQDFWETFLSNLLVRLKPVIKIGYTHTFIVMIIDNLGLGNNHSLLENGWGSVNQLRVHFTLFEIFIFCPKIQL